MGRASWARSGVLEQGRVEGGFRAAAAVAMDDVTNHVLPYDVGQMGGVTVQPPPMATVNDHLSHQETWRHTDNLSDQIHCGSLCLLVMINMCR